MPGPLYCDTSALLKLYLPEPGSAAFNDVVKGRDDSTADALHLALATLARASSIASFDARLAAAARASGFSTYPAA